ncbi:hypothetical protein AA16663_2090 [Komagataeibacter rhaeticus DSM 16663]|nr:hypothetical protein AA16663_2090 [Komagataeibacter rhaeticus DSM 16663]
MQNRIAIKRGRFPMVCPTLLRQRITPHRQAAQAGQRPYISIAQFMDLSHMIQQIMWITWSTDVADPMLPCKSGNPAMPKRIKEQDISFVMLPKHTLKQLYEGLGCCTLHAGTADKNGKGTTGMPGWCPECATHPPGYDFMAQPGNFFVCANTKGTTGWNGKADGLRLTKRGATKQAMAGQSMFLSTSGTSPNAFPYLFPQAR